MTHNISSKSYKEKPEAVIFFFPLFSLLKAFFETILLKMRLKWLAKHVNKQKAFPLVGVRGTLLPRLVYNLVFSWKVSSGGIQSDKPRKCKLRG